MKFKKIAVSIMSMLVVAVMPFTSIAATTELKVLTLDEAVKRTVSNDISIRKSKRMDEFTKAQMSELWNQGEYGKQYHQLALNKEYSEKSQKITEESIAYETSNLFDNIISGEKDKILLDKSIAFQQKQVRKIELEISKGLKSNLELEKAKLELRKMVDKKTILEESIRNQYIQLNTNMGMTNSNMYSLEKPAAIYEPFKLTGTVEGFISSKASGHLSVWKAEEQVGVSSMIDVNKFPTGSYLGYLSEKMDKPNAEDQKQITKQSLEAAFRSQYVRLMQLEEQYITKQEELKVSEKDVKAASLYYEKGLISKMDYDSKVLQHDTLQRSLEKIINEHAQIKVIMDKPYLLSGGGSSMGEVSEE